ALFAGRPDLHLMHAERIAYPPLARQTRISGTVVAQVSVANDGKVDEVKILSGHPLLHQTVVDSLRLWTFSSQAGDRRTFELGWEFGFLDVVSPSSRQAIVTVIEPLRLRILASPVIIDTIASNSK